MIRILYLLSILLFLSCEKKEINPSFNTDCNPSLKTDCVCIAIFDPVCGCDEVTYGNDCEAGCNGIGDFKKGECVYDISPLRGKWNFIGYESEGAKFGSNKKTHSFDMHFTIENIKSDDHFLVSGKSAINLMAGKTMIANKGKLNISTALTTKIGGTLESLKYEEKYIRHLNETADYKVDNSSLSMKITIFEKEGDNIKSEEETLIFTRN